MTPQPAKNFDEGEVAAHLRPGITVDRKFEALLWTEMRPLLRKKRASKAWKIPILKHYIEGQTTPVEYYCWKLPEDRHPIRTLTVFTVLEKGKVVFEMGRLDHLLEYQSEEVHERAVTEMWKELEDVENNDLPGQHAALMNKVVGTMDDFLKKMGRRTIVERQNGTLEGDQSGSSEDSDGGAGGAAAAIPAKVGGGKGAAGTGTKQLKAASKKGAKGGFKGPVGTKNPEDDDIFAICSKLDCFTSAFAENTSSRASAVSGAASTKAGFGTTATAAAASGKGRDSDDVEILSNASEDFTKFRSDLVRVHCFPCRLPIADLSC